MMKKLLFVVASLLLIPAVSCNKSKDAGGDTFSVWVQARPNSYYTSYGDNPVLKYVADKFNIKWDIVQPVVGQETNSLSTMIGTGEYTDMVDLTFYSGSQQELLDEGIIIDIARYLDYMPNFKARLDADPKFRKWNYNDKGQILALRMLSAEKELTWGGFVYRPDILAEAAGGMVRFPSGNDHPVTIADWDYMLPLYKKYFDSHNINDGWAFIIPYNALYSFGDLISSFGVFPGIYISNDTVRFGLVDDGFRRYVEKLREWYAKGYIYGDFMSRVNDYFMLPNPALTYAGKIGVWYGLVQQLGNLLSLPDAGLTMNVQPIPNPIDAAHGITAAPTIMINEASEIGGGMSVFAACKNIPKLLSVWDYFYSEEGGMLYNGLTKEQGADKDPVYINAGLHDGAYWFDENKTLVYNPLLSIGGGSLELEYFNANAVAPYRQNSFYNEYASEDAKNANRVWDSYPRGSKLGMAPSAMSFSTEEEKIVAAINTRIGDIQNTALAAFITGATPINDQTWAQFVKQLNDAGLAELLRINLASYNRFLKR